MCTMVALGRVSIELQRDWFSPLLSFLHQAPDLAGTAVLLSAVEVPRNSTLVRGARVPVFPTPSSSQADTVKSPF